MDVHDLALPVIGAPMAGAAGDTDVAHMWAVTGHVHTRASTVMEITLSLAR
jgi:hypothetical protein